MYRTQHNNGGEGEVRKRMRGEREGDKEGVEVKRMKEEEREPIAKNTTNISQIYHKYTTNVLQNVILYHKNVILYHKNVILYHKRELFTTKCNILPHSMVFFINNLTTNCTILLQNIIFYHKLVYYTMNGSVSTTEKVFYHIV